MAGRAAAVKKAPIAGDYLAVVTDMGAVPGVVHDGLREFKGIRTLLLLAAPVSDSPKPLVRSRLQNLERVQAEQACFLHGPSRLYASREPYSRAHATQTRSAPTGNASRALFKLRPATSKTLILNGCARKNTLKARGRGSAVASALSGSAPILPSQAL